MPDYQQIASILERISLLLRAANEDRWCQVVADALARVRSPWSTTQAAGLSIIRLSAISFFMKVLDRGAE